MQFSNVDHGSQEYESAVALRDRVLRKPLGLQFTTEQLAAESEMIHLVGEIEGQVRACCVLVQKDDGWFHLRQVAVEPDFQSQGYGQKLMEFAHQQILATNGSTGAAQIFCHARDVAETFYQRLGYRAVGERFEEVSIQHVRMEKDLVE